MYDELTEVDIQKMKDEIDYRTLQHTQDRKSVV